MIASIMELVSNPEDNPLTDPPMFFSLFIC
jgi:hypothetical protein